ncbi:MAG: hypothetical protein Q9188_003706 [Gyalolechia gomerana]
MPLDGNAIIAHRGLIRRACESGIKCRQRDSGGWASERLDTSSVAAPAPPSLAIYGCRYPCLSAIDRKEYSKILGWRAHLNDEGGPRAIALCATKDDTEKE